LWNLSPNWSIFEEISKTPYLLEKYWLRVQSGSCRRYLQKRKNKDIIFSHSDIVKKLHKGTKKKISGAKKAL